MIREPYHSGIYLDISTVLLVLLVATASAVMTADVYDCNCQPSHALWSPEVGCELHGWYAQEQLSSGVELSSRVWVCDGAPTVSLS